MKFFPERCLSMVPLLAAADQVLAARAAAVPVSVPVDSPWALGALGLLVSVIAARVIVRRR